MEKPILDFNSSEVVDLSVTSWTENFLIGAYLITAGIISLILNTSVISALIRYPLLSAQPQRNFFLHICLAAEGMTILGGFIFSGTSSFAGRWLFGDSGCLWYAFCGFFFGIASITIIFVMIFFKNENASRNIKQKMKNRIIYSWIWALFWAFLPMFGWSSYDYEPSGKTCTINWQINDSSYVSYIACLTVFAYIIPIAVATIKIVITVKRKRKARNIDISSDASVGNVFRLTDLKICLALIFVVISCWSGYAILCLWVTVKSVETVPYVFTLLPPLFAKLSTIMIPVVMLSYDHQLRMATIASLLCKKPNKEAFPNIDSTRTTTFLEDS